MVKYLPLLLVLFVGCQSKPKQKLEYFKEGKNGGLIVSVPDTKYCVEPVMTDPDVLRLHIVDKDGNPLKIDNQNITAHARLKSGREDDTVKFYFYPIYRADSIRTDQFGAQIPKSFVGKSLRVVLSEIRIDERYRRVDFDVKEYTEK